MIAQRSGSIINMASAQGHIGLDGWTAYAGAKGAVMSMTRQMAVEFGPHNVRINSISPGTINTPMNVKVVADLGDHVARAWVKMHPIGRIGDAGRDRRGGDLPRQRRRRLHHRHRPPRRRRPDRRPPLRPRPGVSHAARRGSKPRENHQLSSPRRRGPSNHRRFRTRVCFDPFEASDLHQALKQAAIERDANLPLEGRSKVDGPKASRGRLAIVLWIRHPNRTSATADHRKIMNEAVTPKALAGVTILDFSHLLQGPFATQLLADMGADVIKIERAGAGDMFRSMTFFAKWVGGSESPNFLAWNRNKRSIALNLKSPKVHAIIMEMAKHADVVVQNFRPGVLAKLGYGYEDFKAVNPRIIYCSGSGYGEEGPYVDRPGQDMLIQGLAGLIANTGRGDEAPVPAGAGLADQIGAMNMVYGILSALYWREKTGKGQKIEVNLLAGMLAHLAQEYVAVLNLGEDFVRPNSGIGHPGMQAPFGIYETSDGARLDRDEPVQDALRDAERAAALAVYDDLKTLFDKRDEVWEKVNAETSKFTTADLLEAAARRRHLVRRGEGHPPRRGGPAGQAHGHAHQLRAPDRRHRPRRVAGREDERDTGDHRPPGAARRPARPRNPRRVRRAEIRDRSPRRLRRHDGANRMRLAMARSQLCQTRCIGCIRDAGPLRQ